MSLLWTSAEVGAVTGATVAGTWMAQGVSIDSRTLARGDLFVALVGPNDDAHRHVAAALEQGAAGALVSHHPVDVEGTAPLAVVADTQAALEALGEAGRTRSRARVAAVTGSVGKTGVKEALRHVLARQGGTHASAASHNNHWGVPLSLARLPPDAAFGVFELGMNHAGEIAALTRLVRPHVALITLIAPAHLGHFPDLEAIADAKAEILEGLEPDGRAVLNRDDPFYPRLRAVAVRAGRDVLTFGAEADADCRLVDSLPDAHGSAVIATWQGRRIAYRIGAPGRHWVVNSLAVLATVVALGADLEAAAEALADLPALAGRGRRLEIRVPGGSAVLLDEAYNANPTSMQAAIEVLGGQPGRRIAVLGDMLELGDHAPAMHAALARPLARATVQRVFTCGPSMEHLAAALPDEQRGGHAATARGLVEPLRAALRADDVVLVKGSQGMGMRQILDALATAVVPGPARTAAAAVAAAPLGAG